MPSTKPAPFGFTFTAAEGSHVNVNDDITSAQERSVGSVEFLKTFESAVMRAVEEDEEQEDDHHQSTPARSQDTDADMPGTFLVRGDAASLLGTDRNSTPPLTHGSAALPVHNFPTILPLPNNLSSPGGLLTSVSSHPGNMVTNGGAPVHATAVFPPPSYNPPTTTVAASNGSHHDSTHTTSPRAKGNHAASMAESHTNMPHIYCNSSVASSANSFTPRAGASTSPTLGHAGHASMPAAVAVPPAMLSGVAAASGVTPLALQSLTGTDRSPSKSANGSTTTAPVIDPNDEEVRSNLFVCNLPPSVRDDKLNEIFGKYGKIQSAKVMLNIHTGESRGIAFVKYTNVTSAENALRELHDSDIFSTTQRLIVRIANAKAAYLPGAPTNKTFVRNIPLELSKQDLMDFFSQFGEVLDVSIHQDTAGENAAAAAAAAAAGVRLSSPQPKKISVAPIVAIAQRQNAGGEAADDASGGGIPGSSPRSDGNSHAPGSEEEERKLNIAFITYADKESARRAAEATHTKTPFKECKGVPLLSKVAEDNFRRNERLHRKFARVATPGQSTTSQPSASASSTTAAVPPGFLVGAPFDLSAASSSSFGALGPAYGFSPASSATGYGMGGNHGAAGGLPPPPPPPPQGSSTAVPGSGQGYFTPADMSGLSAMGPTTTTTTTTAATAAGMPTVYFSNGQPAPFVFPSAAGLPPGTTPSANIMSFPGAIAGGGNNVSVSGGMEGYQPVYFIPQHQLQQQQPGKPQAVPLQGLLPHNGGAVFGSVNGLGPYTAAASNNNNSTSVNGVAGSSVQPHNPYSGSPVQSSLSSNTPPQMHVAMQQGGTPPAGFISTNPQVLMLSPEQQAQMQQLFLQQHQQPQPQMFWSA